MQDLYTNVIRREKIFCQRLFNFSVEKLRDMSQQYKPENVLRRAEDFISLGQPQQALDHLHQFIVHKRTRLLDHQNEQLIQVVKLFIDIAVSHRDFDAIRDALHQFKRGAVNSPEGITALETVVKYLLVTANSKLAQAQQDASSATELHLEQSAKSALEASRAFAGDEEEQDASAEDDESAAFNVSPENILLSAVSTDNTSERSQKEFFLPWLKFTWEAYRTVIDLLKNNNQLEIPYCFVINQVFQFCYQYNRIQEFRKFCEILRSHMQSVITPDYKPAMENPDAINIATNQDSLQRLIETRFVQLDTAVKLSLWKESFKSVDDVQSLMKYSKKSPKPSSLVKYYKNLSEIFKISKNPLFDSASKLKLFLLNLKNPNITKDELSQLANMQLLSTLCIPLQGSDDVDVEFFKFDNILDYDFKNRKNIKFSSLLNLKELPTLDSLFNVQLVKENVNDDNLSQLVALLNAEELDPLKLKVTIEPILTKLASVEAYKPYLENLKYVINQKILLSISSKYETLTMEFLLKLLFLEDEFALEDFLLEIEHIELLPLHYLEIDYESQTIFFIPKIVDNELTNLAAIMQSINYALSGADDSIEVGFSVAKKCALGNELFLKDISQLESEYDQLKLEEKQLADEKVEFEAKLAQERLELAEKEKILAKEKHAQDEIDREQQRLDKQNEMIRLDQIKNLVKEINANGIIQIKFDDVKNMTQSAIKTLELNQLEKDRNEMLAKLELVSKRTDYLERASREAELPLLQEEANKVLDLQKVEYEEMKNSLIEKAKQEYDADVKLKERLARFVDDYQQVLENTKNAATEQYEQEKAEASKALEEAKKIRIQEYIAQKKQEFIDNKSKAKAAAEAEAKAREAARAREELLAAREAAAAQRKNQFGSSSGSAYTPPSRRQFPAATPAAAPAAAAASEPAAPSSSSAPIDVSKLTMAEKIKLKRLGHL